MHIQKDVPLNALCWFLCPVSAALASTLRMDLIFNSHTPSVGFRIQDFGFGIEELWFRVEGSACKVHDLGCRV